MKDTTDDKSVPSEPPSNKSNSDAGPPKPPSAKAVCSGDGEYDPLDINNLRMDQAELDRPAVKPVLLSIPIRRPDRLEFIRVRAGEEFRVGPVPFIELRGPQEIYLVDPRFKPELRPKEYWVGMIYLAITQYDKPFLWATKLQSPTGKTSSWYDSAQDCAEQAMREWLQVESDQDAGIYLPKRPVDEFPEPAWPEQSMQELIRLGFKRRIVDSLDHPVMKRLRGRV
jgi:hypothetical protein